MEDLNLQMRRISSELWTLQQELVRQAAGSGQGKQSASSLVSSLDFDAASDLKGALDHMRHLVWSFIDEMKSRTGASSDDLLLSYRARRATEMLRMLRPAVLNPNPPATPEVNLLFEEIRAFGVAPKTRSKTA